jgi:hypothetical protein
VRLDGNDDHALAVNLVRCSVEGEARRQVLLDLRPQPTLINELAVPLRDLAGGSSAFIRTDHDVAPGGGHPSDVLRQDEQVTRIVEVQLLLVVERGRLCLLAE